MREKTEKKDRWIFADGEHRSWRVARGRVASRMKRKRKEFTIFDDGRTGRTSNGFADGSHRTASRCHIPSRHAVAENLACPQAWRGGKIPVFLIDREARKPGEHFVGTTPGRISSPKGRRALVNGCDQRRGIDRGAHRNGG